MEPRPLVSCIMPTRNRKRFVLQSIEYFKRQDYAPRELVILDGGDENLADSTGLEIGRASCRERV